MLPKGDEHVVVVGSLASVRRKELSLDIPHTVTIKRMGYEWDLVMKADGAKRSGDGVSEHEVAHVVKEMKSGRAPGASGNQMFSRQQAETLTGRGGPCILPLLHLSLFSSWIHAA